MNEKRIHRLAVVFIRTDSQLVDQGYVLKRYEKFLAPEEFSLVLLEVERLRAENVSVSKELAKLIDEDDVLVARDLIKDILSREETS